MNSALCVCALLLVCGTAVSCGNNTERRPAPSRPAAVRPLAFETTAYATTHGECRGDTTPCLTIRLRYPTATGGVDSARSAINSAIEQYVLSTLAGHIADSTQRASSIDSLAQALIADYDRYIEEAREYAGFVMPWEITMEGKVLHRDSAVVSVAIDTYSYMGGAHPNYWTSFKNFVPSTGTPLSIDDIALDRRKLTALAEQAFRREKQLRPNQDLDKAGYWFGNNRFGLPDNFAFTEKGLVFVYNPYEIASYAEGPTELLLPYADLRGIVRPEFL